MALNQDQINNFRIKAKQSGYSDAEIQQEIARKSQEASPIQQPQAPVVQPQKQQQTLQTPIVQPSTSAMVGRGAITGAKSAASVIGSAAMQAPQFVKSLAYEIAKPAIKGGKTVASGVEEGIQSVKYLSGDKQAFKSPILPSSIKLSEKEKQQIREKPIEEAVKQTAGIGSYAVPFGRAGFIGSKAVVPGAAVAASRSVSEGETPEEVVGNAIIGGATAGTLQMGGKVLSKLKGGSKSLSKTTAAGAESIEEGSRKIRLKPSIYGAQQEKAINRTLDSLGFKGHPQQQYEQLQPAMNKLEEKIKTFIVENPGISVPKENIKKSFLKKLSSTVRSGELTQKKASAETERYLNDLIKASGGKGKFTDISIERLRELKKLINEDYGPVKIKLDNGSNLTPEQHVIKVAWDSLDNAVKSSAPQVKNLLVDESNLYKAAPSLSSARVNPPTLRFAGISVPQGVTQGLRDAATGTLKKTSEGLGRVSDAIPNVNMRPAIGQAVRQIGGQSASVLPRLGPTTSVIESAPQGQNEIQDGLSGDNSQIYPEDQQYNTHNNSISQDTADVNGLGPVPRLNQWGASPAELYKEYQNAYAAGDTKTAAFLYKAFEDESKYEKDNKSAEPKKLSGAINKEVARNQTALKDINELEQILLSDPTKVMQSAIPGSPGARKYRALWGGILDAIGTNRTGATYTPEQRKDYEQLLPTPFDSPDTIRYKMARIKMEVNNFLNTVSGSGPDYDPVIGQTQGLGPIDSAIPEL